MTEQEQALLYEQLGFRIRELREKAGIKQTAFARMLNLSRASVVNIEKGRQRILLHMLWDFSKILGVEVRELMSILEDYSKPTHEKLNSDWEKAIKSTKSSKTTQIKLTEFIKQVTLKDNS